MIDTMLKRLMHSALQLSERFETNFDQAPPVSQMMALTRLLDRIIKLDSRKPRLQKSKAYIIRYQYPDGTFHKVPPWYGGDDEDDENVNLWTRRPHLPTTSLKD